ncbi:MAG: AAA family ATPase [Candidatus Hodarchaeota archaeon]
MKITKIKLENFGPFYKTHEINFPSDGKGVHVIRGNTGQGKTSLQRAILWCLYGKVYDRNNKEIPLTSLLNRSCVKENEFCFAVSIHFIHENSDWVLTRKTKALYHMKSKYEKGMKLYLVINNVPVEEKAREKIEKILPAVVSRFFFFDGEMLVRYEELLNQDSQSMKILKKSIEHILGIPYLRLARNDLNAIIDDINGEINKILKRMGGKDCEELAKFHGIIIAEIKRKKEQIDLLEKQMEELDLNIKRLKRKALEFESTKNLALKRIKLESEIEKSEAEIKQNKLKLHVMNSDLYKSVLMPIAKNIIDQLRLKHDKVMSKYDQKQRLIETKRNLEQGINNQICRLCGTVLNSSLLEQFRKELKEVELKIDSLTEIPEPNLIYDNSAKYLEGMGSELVNPSIYSQLEDKNTEIIHKIASVKEELSQVKDKLRDVDEEEPFRLENQIDTANQEFGRLLGEQNKLKELLEKDLKDQREIDQELSRIDQDELNKIKALKKYLEQVSGVFEKSISIYREKRRKEVESKATEIFRQIRSKKDFSGLEINRNFGLSIITEDGTVIDKAEWRSAGEEQLVALALIGALNNCAQIDAPVFMDTPFARLDTKHGQRVLSYIPKMSEQVAIFVTDREYRKEDEKYLSEYVVSDHTLVHKGERIGTIIVKNNLTGE